MKEENEKKTWETPEIVDLDVVEKTTKISSSTETAEYGTSYGPASS